MSGDRRPALRLVEDPKPGIDARVRARVVASHPSQGIRRRPILYIGGDVDGRILFTRIARRWQAVKVLVAPTGREGVRMAAERRVGMVVMQAALPDVDALDVLGVIKAPPLSRSAPVVVVAHDGTSVERARFLWAGASAYVSTPLNITEIDRAVGMLLEVAAIR